jgi:hypothetical protein
LILVLILGVLINFGDDGSFGFLGISLALVEYKNIFIIISSVQNHLSSNNELGTVYGKELVIR